MGRPKVKMIDDSAPAEEKETKKVKKLNPNPDAKSAKDDAQENSNNTPAVSETEEMREETESAGSQGPKQSKKAKQSVAKKVRSKKYLEAVKELDKTKYYKAAEAIETIKQRSYSTYTGTLEAHVNTIQTGMRGLVALPYASGKKIRILTFGNGAEESGADIVGTDETIEEINKGKINFDLVVTTPQWMPKLARVARILGPRGIMPNPKNGTITDDVKKAVEGFQAGKTEYKTESKAPIIHISLGKLDQPTEELTANIKALVMTLGKTRIKKVTLAPTQGPSVKVDLSSL